MNSQHTSGSRPCPQCRTPNPTEDAYCSQCGSSLRVAPGEMRQEALPAPPTTDTAGDISGGFSARPHPKPSPSQAVVIWALILVVTVLSLLLAREYMAPGDKAALTPVEVTPTPVDPYTQKLSRVKALWNEGAQLKGERQYAKAATAWMKALEILPDHPGIQEAIDKLPVEVTYIVEAPRQAEGENIRCTITYLNHRQRTNRLNNVRLPWKGKFLAKKGQRLSIAASSRQARYPVVVSIVRGEQKMNSVSSFTSWWLGYLADIKCTLIADYQNTPQLAIRGELWNVDAPNPQDEAKTFLDKLQASIGEGSELLVSDALAVDNTDILMLTVGDGWEQVTTENRIGAAQDFYNSWRGIRQPVNGKQVYLMLLDGQARRMGGSKYPNGSQLWVVNQGATGKPMRIPPEIMDGASGGGNSESASRAADSGGEPLPQVSKDPLRRYRTELKKLPSIERFVNSVVLQNDSIVQIWVSNEYHTLSYQNRLALAQGLQKIWIICRSPNQPSVAHTVLKAADGTSVGGTDMWGKVWVEQ